MAGKLCVAKAHVSGAPQVTGQVVHITSYQQIQAIKPREDRSQKTEDR
jgi:hypothetical protein